MFGALLAIWRFIIEVVSFWRKVNIPYYPSLARLLPFWPPISTPPHALPITMTVALTPIQKLSGWYTRKNPVDLWLELLRRAETFEDWEEAALHLDNLLGLDLWYVYPRCRPRPRLRATLTWAMH